MGSTPSSGTIPADIARRGAAPYNRWRSRNERRAARGRWLIASNGTFQALMTYYYWVDDAPWAAPAWERIVETLDLGRSPGRGESPGRWSVQDRN